MAFYRANVDAVYRYLGRLTGGDRARTEDLTQATFVSIAAQADRAGQVNAGWAHTVARTTFLQDVRTRGRDDRRSERYVRESLADVGPDVLVTDFTAEHVADRVAVGSAIAALSDLQRAALVLRYVDDLAVAEVAALLGRSEDATESLIRRAIAALRLQLEVDRDR